MDKERMLEEFREAVDALRRTFDRNVEVKNLDLEGFGIGETVNIGGTEFSVFQRVKEYLGSEPLTSQKLGDIISDIEGKSEDLRSNGDIPEESKDEAQKVYEFDLNSAKLMLTIINNPKLQDSYIHLLEMEDKLAERENNIKYEKEIREQENALDAGIEALEGYLRSTSGLEESDPRRVLLEGIKDSTIEGLRGKFGEDFIKTTNINKILETIKARKEELEFDRNALNGHVKQEILDKDMQSIENANAEVNAEVNAQLDEMKSFVDSEDGMTDEEKNDKEAKLAKNDRSRKLLKLQRLNKKIEQLKRKEEELKRKKEEIKKLEADLVKLTPGTKEYDDALDNFKRLEAEIAELTVDIRAIAVDLEFKDVRDDGSLDDAKLLDFEKNANNGIESIKNKMLNDKIKAIRYKYNIREANLSKDELKAKIQERVAEIRKNSIYKESADLTPEENGAGTPPTPETGGAGAPPASSGRGAGAPPVSGGSGAGAPPVPGGREAGAPPVPGGSGAVTPPAPGERGGATPPASGERGGATPPASGERGGATPPAPGESGGATPPASGERGGATPPAPGESGTETPTIPGVSASEGSVFFGSKDSRKIKEAEIGTYEADELENGQCIKNGIVHRVEKTNDGKLLYIEEDLSIYSDDSEKALDEVIKGLKNKIAGEFETKSDRKEFLNQDNPGNKMLKRLVSRNPFSRASAKRELKKNIRENQNPEMHLSFMNMAIALSSEVSPSGIASTLGRSKNGQIYKYNSDAHTYCEIPEGSKSKDMKIEVNPILLEEAKKPKDYTYGNTSFIEQKREKAKQRNSRRRAHDRVEDHDGRD